MVLNVVPGRYNVLVPSTAIRLVLAFAMLAWSPAWCCCAIRAAALGGEACDAAGLCCSRMSLDIQAQNMCPKCTSKAACCDSGDDGEPQPGPCRCNDRAHDMNRLHTVAKASLPPLEVQPLAMPPVTCSNCVHEQHVTATGDIVAAAQPPPPTLLAQRCLLLI